MELIFRVRGYEDKVVRLLDCLLNRLDKRKTLEPTMEVELCDALDGDPDEMAIDDKGDGDQ
jgi:hypothetical protein